MTPPLLTLALLAPPEGEASDASAVKRDYLRDEYRADAKKYTFWHDESAEKELKLVEKPMMRWDTDDDWSGDVFVWTHEGRPEVVGCILSGPGGETSRHVFHEFHLLAERPIPAVNVHT